ncbi:hypothetical protein ACGF5C_21475 [Micromonospora sp. NPDC047620]|uniref:hypothetical protein n=1 Tax=Micromonospora sp. NPDC047620 TaxID=3364251 RepID=UPI003717F1A6
MTGVSTSGLTTPTHDRTIRGGSGPLRRWVVDPTVRGLTGLPLALAAAPSALFAATTLGRLQLRLADRYSGGTGVERQPKPQSIGPVRVLAHSFLVLIPASAAFALVVLQMILIWSGHLYPLRPDAVGAIGHPFTADPLLNGAWGGPTLAGAWLVHSALALAIQVCCAGLLRGLLAAMNRITRRVLGG